MNDDEILRIENISKHFGGVIALDNVQFSLKKGEIHALLGENGAGKSTLMKILSGVYRPDKGTVLLEGKKVHVENPVHSRELGIGIIYQEFSLVPYLTVAENIFLGRERCTKMRTLRKKDMYGAAKKFLSHLGVDIDPDTLADELSVADQQFVEICKATAADISILILDEPTATLTPSETGRLFTLMRELKNKGVSMIFISHHLEEIFEIVDRVTIFRDGQYISTKNIQDCSIDLFVKLMVGRDIQHSFPPKEKESIDDESPPALEVIDLRRKEHMPTLSFSVQKGEILGIAGLVGSGRSELMRAVFGADAVVSKTIKVNGKKVKVRSPREAMSHGIGLLPEDRKTQGLILPFSVERNVMLNNTGLAMTKLGTLSHKRATTLVETQIAALNVKTPSIWQEVENLSGGNQQKVVMAKWLSTMCSVLIFDEPTRGIDIGAKIEIYNIMRTLTQKGLAVIMVSSELSEVVGMSDRVLVIRNNGIAKELIDKDIDPETIMLHAAGGSHE